VGVGLCRFLQPEISRQVGPVTFVAGVSTKKLLRLVDCLLYLAQNRYLTGHLPNQSISDMEQSAQQNDIDVVSLTADIVAAYVSNNSVSSHEVSVLISSVHSALQGLVAGPAVPEAEPLKPPVPIKKSVTPDHIISLEDGKPYKSLKRHLARLGLTPVQYREKWGLPRDYPMVAPSYSERRSELAKKTGLGQSRKRPVPEPVVVAPVKKTRAKSVRAS
jgi:predicted transcriptional regulator